MLARIARLTRAELLKLASHPFFPIALGLLAAATLLGAWGKAIPFPMEKGPSFSRSARAARSSGSVREGSAATRTRASSASASSLVRAASPHRTSFGFRSAESFTGVGF